MTDAELVVRAVAGDPAAFAELVTRHHAACLRYAAHVLGDPMEAEDVVQETLLRAYRSLDRYEARIEGAKLLLVRLRRSGEESV